MRLPALQLYHAVVLHTPSTAGETCVQVRLSGAADPTIVYTVAFAPYQLIHAAILYSHHRVEV
jgi:hypothetical protein